MIQEQFDAIINEWRPWLEAHEPSSQDDFFDTISGLVQRVTGADLGHIAPELRGALADWYLDWKRPRMARKRGGARR